MTYKEEQAYEVADYLPLLSIDGVNLSGAVIDQIMAWGRKCAVQAREREQNQTKQKPVVWFDSNACEGDENQVCGMKTKRHTTPLYTHPPKREWVGLTDEDMRLCLAAADYNQARYKRTQYWAHLATAIEAKLREKNGC
jgi:hypothetical protein